ncbi:hypothetical protein [Devosia sediminis]|uniref:Uncharacterized protein n=1 Tax=Devosia sediminis TaxID=2798801 RepID=A0A934MPV9_9HYPH|nr:hypothetical protein [Devosia sediminis]MBJ3783739.1 hypothetical protein [Devosia sediminis]
MPIDRRITNGLAWAGALLVVAIPVADFATSQFDATATPQVAVVDPVDTPEPDASAERTPTLPTPVSERPKPVAVAEKPAASAPVAAKPAEPAPEPVAKPDPVTTASAGNKPSGGTAVDDFLNTGRPLPSYITGAGAAAPTQSASVPAPAPATTPKPVSTPTTVAPAPASSSATVSAATTPAQVATVPNRVAGFPTPVAQRPASLPRSQAVTLPPQAIGNDPTFITAEDLEDWESGPLSEFLARRQGGGQTAPSDYDPNGFFLDQGPNSGVNVRRFPNAYDEYFYPFE